MRATGETRARQARISGSEEHRERVNHARVELGSAASAQLRHRVGGRHGLAVGLCLRHRIEGVGNGQDAGAERKAWRRWNLCLHASQAPLLTRPNDLPHLVEGHDISDHVARDIEALAHDLAILPESARPACKEQTRVSRVCRCHAAGRPAQSPTVPDRRRPLHAQASRPGVQRGGSAHRPAGCKRPTSIAVRPTGPPRRPSRPRGPP